MTSGPDSVSAGTGGNFSPVDSSLFQRFGGEVFFEDFAREFYEGVAVDVVLRAMYPEDDLAPAQRRFQLFLQQYWGGPATYSQERGHPRLRMRHAPFAISADARDRWLACAHRAWRSCVATHAVDDEAAADLWRYLQASADAMMNTFD